MMSTILRPEELAQTKEWLRVWAAAARDDRGFQHNITSHVQEI